MLRLHKQLGCQPIGTAAFLLSFAVARPGPGTGCNRQLQCPGRFARHQTGEFFDAAETDRHFADELVVHMQHDRIAGGFNAQHRRGKQIAGDAGDDVFGPRAGIGALTVATILELTGGVVGEHHTMPVASGLR